MTVKYSGSCLCGEVAFDISGDFESFYLCHCDRCRKDSGSAHSANLFSTTAKLNWTSGEDKVRMFNLPLTQHVKSFCSICGSAVPTLQDEGKLLVVPAGSLDSKLSMKPCAHIFVSDRAEWDQELENIPMIEKLPNQV